MIDRPHLKTLLIAVPLRGAPVCNVARPCAPRRQPPNLLLDGGPPPLTIATSPFRGITDMFTVWKAPVVSPDGGSPYPWKKVTAYWVVSDPRDGLAPAKRRRGA